MILIVGLGNPGRKYRNTPHNLGFETVDRLRRKHQLPRFQRGEMALISAGKIAEQSVLLAKPLTFMNESGRAVAALAKRHQLEPDQIWLIHDEADLPLGQIKTSLNRSAGGHKGVSSVYQQLQTRALLRFRLGAATEDKSNLKDFVLKPYRRIEKDRVKTMIEQATELIEDTLSEISPK